MEKYKYHYFYKITNQVNGKYYYGIHSTNNLNDGYLGSGSYLLEAKNKFGKENFEKDILKLFPTRIEASEYEKKIVTKELIHDSNCYNIKMGGDYGATIGTILVVDKNNVMHRCTVNDERYISGEWVPFGTGMVSCIDATTNKSVIISVDEYHVNPKKYISFSKNTVMVKDENGKIYRVNKNDERYLSGTLTNFWVGRKHTEETKQKMSQIHKANGNQQGEKNSQFGTCWVTNGSINKKIKKKELEQYLPFGWLRGRITSPPKVILDK